MEAQLQKWGNSIGIRIPAQILKSLDLKENDYVHLIVKDGQLIVTKSNYKTIEDRFKDYKGDYICEEWDEYDVVGKEVW